MTFTSTDQHDSAAVSRRSGRAASSPVIAEPEQENSTALMGLKAICIYAGKSGNTLRKLIRDEDFPASKVGGEWMSDKTKIDQWRLERI